MKFPDPYKYNLISKIIGSVLIFCMLMLSAKSYANSITYSVHKDGSFDIIGTTVSLQNSYPSIDGNSIRPLAVDVTEYDDYTTIRYTLSNGYFELILREEAKGISIKTNIDGDEIVGAAISPIGNAVAKGVTRFYRTPRGIAGDAGIRDWPEGNNKETSHSITGFIPENGHTLVASTRDYRNFYSHSDLFPAGLKGDEQRVTVSLQTEMVHTTSLPKIFITEAESAFRAMQNEAKEVAEVMNARNETEQAYHWNSFYYAYHYITEEMMFDFIEGFETVEPRVPIQTFQIDVGYFPHVGDWLEPSRNFPNGLEPTVQKIKDHGYRPGVWVGPYMVGNRSKLYRENPDWVLRNKDGTMAHTLAFYGEDRLWGAMDEEFYLLDTSNPEVMDYLRKVFRTFREMGFTYFKTDFLFWGDRPSHTVERHTPGKTSAQYQRELYEMIREEIGPESFWLGCISNYAPMIGFADAMRISWDIGAEWSYAENFFREVHGQQYFNNIWWQNDPDSIILRSEFNRMTENELESLAYYMGMLGGVVNTSDLFHTIPEKNLEIFRMLEPGEEKRTATFPFMKDPGKIDVLLRELKPGNGWAVLFFNRENSPTTELFSIDDIIEIPEAAVFNWDTEGYEKAGEKSEILMQLEPRQSKLFYFSSDGEGPEGINFAGKEL